MTCQSHNLVLNRFLHFLWAAAAFAVFSKQIAGSQPARSSSRASQRFSPRRNDSKAIPRFSIQREGENWWLADRERFKRFFSLGVCSVTRGLSATEFDPENPGLCGLATLQRTVGLADASLKRLKGWGFTTLGAWSDHETLKRSTENDIVADASPAHRLNGGRAMWDMWDPKVVRRWMRPASRPNLAVRDDPHLLGYYTDNELGWWNATLCQDDSRTAGRAARSGNDWSNYCARATKTIGISFSWISNQRTLAVGRTQTRRRALFARREQGIHVMRRFLGVLAERYYSLCRQIISEI